MAAEQLAQLAMLQLTQNPFTSEKFAGQTQFPADTTNVSGHVQVLLAFRVKFPVQFIQLFDELQVKQFITLQLIQFPL